MNKVIILLSISVAVYIYTGANDRAIDWVFDGSSSHSVEEIISYANNYDLSPIQPVADLIVDEYIQLADKAILQNNLLGKKDSAILYLAAAKNKQPENRYVQLGSERLARVYLDWANSAVISSQFKKSEFYLEISEKIIDEFNISNPVLANKQILLEKNICVKRKAWFC